METKGMNLYRRSKYLIIAFGTLISVAVLTILLINLRPKTNPQVNNTVESIQNYTKQKASDVPTDCLKSSTSIVKKTDDRHSTILRNKQLRMAVTNRYRFLFRKLDLNSEEKEKLTRLLFEKQQAKNDALELLGKDKTKVGNRLSKKQLEVIEYSQKDIDDEIKTVLGTEKFDQYVYFEASMGLRQSAATLRTLLSYSLEPLTEIQSEQLIDAWFDVKLKNRATRKIDTTGNSVEHNSPIDLAQMEEIIPNGGLNAARNILKPSQVEVLKRLMARQQAPRSISELTSFRVEKR